MAAISITETIARMSALVNTVLKNSKKSSFTICKLWFFAIFFRIFTAFAYAYNGL